MGLLSFVKEPAVRRQIRRVYDHPNALGPLSPLVPQLASDPRLVGSAFDYFLRFYVQRKNTRTKTEKWLAEKVLERCERAVAKKEWIFIQVGSTSSPNRDGNVALYRRLRNPDGHVGQMRSHFEAAKEEHKKYLQSGLVTNALLRSCCFLARMDWVVRGQNDVRLPRHLRSVDATTLKELRLLAGAITPEIFHTHGKCVLNPRFRAGDAIGGADGDLLIDDLLVEIKVIARRRPDRRDWDQLFGYYGLNECGGIYGLRARPRIRRLGIYSARYAALHVIELQGNVALKVKNYAIWLEKTLKKYVN